VLEDVNSVRPGRPRIGKLPGGKTWSQCQSERPSKIKSADLFGDRRLLTFPLRVLAL
jgi:hypothetical protein